MDKEKVLIQLRRVEGQVRGVTAMVEGDRGLVVTMQQFMAVNAAFRKAMKQYISLFLREQSNGDVVLTKDQVEYILKIIQ